MASATPHTTTPSGCPFPDKASSRQWCPAKATDSRSPCPAINSMANHGYISRDGRSISTWQLIAALKRVYALTWPFATFLVVVGLLIIGHYNIFRPLDLIELARHGRVEHNASLVHDDAPLESSGDKKKIIMAPTEVNQDLVDQLFSDPLLYQNCTPDATDAVPTPSTPPSGASSLGSSTTVAGSPGTDGSRTASAVEDSFERKQAEYAEGFSIPTMDYADVARHRVRRQAECNPTGKIHQEIARGEMAIILHAWSIDRLGKLKTPSSSTGTADAAPKLGAPVSWMREWLSSERLPEEWFDRLESDSPPKAQTGLFDTVKMSKAIRARAEQIVADAAAAVVQGGDNEKRA